MKRPTAVRLAMAAILLGLVAGGSFGGQIVPAGEFKEEAPKIFIDCHQCDMNYLRKEITFVDFVRDRKSADVCIIVSIRLTGSGGREHTMEFLGRNSYIDIKNTMKYVSNPDDSDDDQRRGLARVLKIGLVPYAAKTSVGDFLDVNFEGRPATILRDDRWNSWVFGAGVSGSLSGESTKRFTTVNGWLSANRITRESKLRLGLSGRVSDSFFELEEETITSTVDSQSFSGLYVVSLSEHWSAGTWLSVASSSYSNIALTVNPAPAVEYNFFPYSESTRRQLRFLYRLGLSFNKYMEETIFGKMKENILGHTLSVTFEVKEPWGHISSSVSGSTFLSDFAKNRLEFYSGVSLRLVKGLALNFNGRYSRIHDQVSLPKEDASLEEILLQQKQLATNFSYGLSIGVSFTFGSIYSPVVNPRFGI